jgi:hypothetical protein
MAFLLQIYTHMTNIAIATRICYSYRERILITSVINPILM